MASTRHFLRCGVFALTGKASPPESPADETRGDYEDRRGPGEKRMKESLSGSHTHLCLRLGPVALLRGDRGKRDDDYGNEQALFLKD
ncbi:hypothetical protein KUCAC02_033586 [Chaenocephalus aceratus]|nr:hypothetical protein KUCAC02_033586 [Chaenocephalus aceratus]